MDVDVNWSETPVLVKLTGTLDRVNAKALAAKILCYMRQEGAKLRLSLDKLKAIEDKALRRLLKKISNYRGSVTLVFGEGAKAVRDAIARLPGRFSGFFEDVGPQPA